MINLTLSVPIDWLIRVNAAATKSNISRNGLIQIAVDHFLKSRDNAEAKELTQ